MKILQINTVYKNGGSTGRIVSDLRSQGLQQNIDMYTAYGYEFKKLTPEDYDKTYKICNILQMQWSKLQTRIFARHGFYNYFETKKLLTWIDSIKPDIIHLHNLHNHYINIELLLNYIKKHNIPVVWTLHDCWSFTGWCTYFNMVNCNKWKTGCRGECPCKHNYPYTWFFNRSAQNYKNKRNLFTGLSNLTIVTPSQWLANLVKISFFKHYPIKVINNGVDTEIFTPTNLNIRTKYSIPPHAKIILTVINAWSKRKGIDYLLQIPNHLRENEYLVIVGLKSKQLAILPQEHCIGICRTDNIKELAALYTEASVFINPTLEDNFPTTNIESLACGTPVVTFDTGGSIECIDNKTGIIVPQKNLNSLITAIREIIQKGKSAYSHHCIVKAQTLYEKKKQYQKYIDLYFQIYKSNKN